MQNLFNFRFGFFITAILIVLCASFPVKAQSQDWLFVWDERYPSPAYGCPFQGGCQGFSSQPRTKIAYASDSYTVMPHEIINNLDRNLFATFNGGNMMGGSDAAHYCRFETQGYGTFHNDEFGTTCNYSQDNLTVNFSRPVSGRRMYLRGKYPQRLVVTESGRAPFYVDMTPGTNPASNGTATAYLSGRKITGLTVKSLDAEYAFTIDSIRVGKIPSTSS